MALQVPFGDGHDFDPDLDQPNAPLPAVPEGSTPGDNQLSNPGSPFLSPYGFYTPRGYSPPESDFSGNNTPQWPPASPLVPQQLFQQFVNNPLFAAPALAATPAFVDPALSFGFAVPSSHEPLSYTDELDLIMDPFMLNSSFNSSSKAIFRWDGMQRGEGYDQGKAAILQMDSMHKARNPSSDVSKQWNIADRLALTLSCIAPDTDGWVATSAFKRHTSYYMSRTVLNQYMPFDEAVEISKLIVLPLLSHSLAQAGPAEEALRKRLELQYKPIAEAASLLQLLAPTPVQLQTAKTALEDARSAVSSLGSVPVQAAGESQATFSSRTDAYNSSIATAQEAEQAAETLYTKYSTSSKIAHFVMVDGDFLSPSDALYRFYWVVMDIIFGLGDQDRLQQFYKLAHPNSQGNDSIALFGQRVKKVFNDAAHLVDPATKSPEIVFTKGLNSRSMQAQLQQWRDANLTEERDPLVRLSRTIEQAKNMEGFSQNAAQFDMHYAVMTGRKHSGAGFSRPPLSGQGGDGASGQHLDSSSAASVTNDFTRNAAGHLVTWRRQSIPAASRILLNNQQRWTQEHQDKVLGDTRSEEKLTAIVPGLNIAIRQPHHMEAICVQCDLKARHTNRFCRKTNKAALAAQVVTPQEDMQQQQTAAQSSQLQAHSSTAYASSSSSEMATMMQALSAMNMQLQQLAVAAAAQSHGQVKPGKAFGADGNKPSHPQGSNPCPTCEFKMQHDCWYANPQKARDNWRPTDQAPIKAVITYVTKCLEHNIVPKLDRVQATLQEASRKGMLPPALLHSPSVQQALQIRTAAAGWTDPSQLTAGSVHSMFSTPPTTSNWNDRASMYGGSLFGCPAPSQYGTAAPPHAAMGQQQQPPFNPWAASSSNAAANTPAAPSAPAPPGWSHLGFLAQVDPAQLLAAAEQQNPESFTAAEAVYAMAATRQRKPIGFESTVQTVPADPNTQQGGRYSPKESSGQQLGLLTQVLLSTAQLISSAVGMLSTAAAEQLLQLTRALQRSFTQADLERQVIALTEFFTALQAAVPDFKTAALQMLMQHAAAPLPVAAAATATATKQPQLQSLLVAPQLLFTPQPLDYQAHLQSTQVLNRLSSPDPAYGLYVQFGQGQRFGINLAVSDDGSNILLITEQQCKRMGIQVLQQNLPELRGIDGELRPYIIGRTPPAELTVGLGTDAPMRKQVPCLWVVGGDAGGMYDVLIDKDTFKEWYAHVNPVYGHYIWYPHAARGDFGVINGVPVQSSITRQAAMAAVTKQFACAGQAGFVFCDDIITFPAPPPEAAAAANAAAAPAPVAAAATAVAAATSAVIVAPPPHTRLQPTDALQLSAEVDRAIQHRHMALAEGGGEFILLSVTSASHWRAACT